MNERSFHLLVVWLFASLLAAVPARAADSVTKDAHGVTLALPRGILRLQVWTDRIIRVTFTVADKLPADASFSVIAKPGDVKWEFQEADDRLTIKTAALETQVDRATGAVQFHDLTGKTILAEPADGGRSMDPITLAGQPSWKIRQVFQLSTGEALFGLGQHPDGVMNYVGHRVHLQQRNTDVALPVLVSSAGYGILWDNPSITDVAAGLAAEKPDTVQWSAEVGDSIDYYFLYGPTADQTVSDYRQLTGAVPMLGKWAWGLWQSKERYASQDELLWIVEQYRSRHIPLDGIIQDWQYWSPGPWGSHHLDASRYYDPKAMVRTLHDENIHMLISVWAKFDTIGANYNELDKAGVLYKPVLASVYPQGHNRWYDAFNETGRSIYWNQISKDLFSLGIDGWWLDATEPELSGHWGEFRDFTTAAGPGAKVFNAYPLMTTSAVYNGQRAQTSDKRVLILTRSAYPGQQRNSAVTWSGDIHATWPVFTHQIAAGINFCLAGIPYWNTDIGGFFGSNPADPKFCELFTRWFQFGAFCPMFRVHGTDQPKELWRFNPQTFKILLTYDQLRYRLFPYIYSVAWSVTHENSTMMRGLVFDFVSDPKVYDIADQYMFGPAIMVNPVTKAGAKTRPVYLPLGSKWFDFWTGKSLDGGRPVEMDSPIETLPLLVRAGSIIPMAPPAQSVMEKSSQPIELRVYPGADGSFTLYDDEGDNYDYEKGQHTEITLTWSEARQVLTIGKRRGEFPGMEPNRTFRIVRVHDGAGVGVEPAEKVDAENSYTGESVEVPLTAR